MTNSRNSLITQVFEHERAITDLEHQRSQQYWEMQVSEHTTVYLTDHKMKCADGYKRIAEIEAQIAEHRREIAALEGHIHENA